MADEDYPKFKFSVTCHSSDLAVVHCLRGLAQWAERHPIPQIGWGGSGVKEWQAGKGTFVLRFTDPQYRKTFIEKGRQLLPKLWNVLTTSDADPAMRRRTKH